MINKITKQLGEAKWEVQEVNFPTANVDYVLTHKLLPIQPWDVRFTVTDTKVGGSLYRGVKPATQQYVVLRATVAGKYRIRLFIETQASNTSPI